MHIKSLMDILLSTDAYSGTNLIGQYQSQLTKDVAEVLKQYERDNIYLGNLDGFK